MKVSVALCTYNGERFLKTQLESILNQTKSVDEIVICDDGSTDATTEIVEEFIKQYPTIIKFHINASNLKVNKNFEKAITLTTGDYIFLSDQDDIWNPEKVEKIIAIFENNQKIEGVFSNATIIDQEGKIVTGITLWDAVNFNEKEFTKPINLFKLISSYRNMVTGATLCFKRQIKDLILPIPFHSSFFHDEWIAMVLAKRESLFYSKENLISYRTHESQQVGVSDSKNNNEIGFYVHGDKVPTKPTELRKLTKLYYNNYSRFKEMDSFSTSQINFNEVAIENFEKFVFFKIKIRNNFPFHYFCFQLIDKIRNKRQYR